jgi:hypothetical protein
MRTSTRIFRWFLPLLLAAGCDGGGVDRGREIDLRPTWATGQVYRVREEQRERSGKGPFPPEAALENRTEGSRRELHIFREEVLEADRNRLYRVRRTYLTSVRGRDGNLEPTAVAGKTYEIRNPYPLQGLPAMEVRVRDAGGRFEPATAEEAREIGKSAYRLTFTLLPAGPVRRGDPWFSGRQLGPLEFEPKSDLVRIAKLEEGREAVLVWEPRGRLRVPGDSRVSMRERLTLDLENGRIGAYRTEAQYRSATPRESWRWITMDVTLTTEGNEPGGSGLNGR